MYSYSYSKSRLSVFLLLVTAVSATFAFVPSARAQTSTITNSNLCSQVDDTTTTMATPKWFQCEISITAPSRGCHLITSDVNKAIQKDMSNIRIGMANLFIQHTSASLTINENADPDVRR